MDREKMHSCRRFIQLRRPLLTPSLDLSYGLPVLSIYFLFGPITILQGIYAKYYGLALTSIALVLLIARLFDALIDPIIGYCADRYYTKKGNYKPFIISGGVLFIISSWFLYVPFDFSMLKMHEDVSVGYFLGWFLAFYLAYTLFEIPHLAWGSELATNSLGRNRTYGFRTFCAFLGTLLFFAVPLLPWFDTNEFTPQTLKWSVLVAGTILLPTLYLCIKIVPDTGPLSLQHRQNEGTAKKISNNQSLRSIFGNKPLLMLTAAHICTGFGSGMWLSLLFIFVDAYLNLGDEFSLVYVTSFALSIVVLRIWYQMANYFGKQVTWMTGMAFMAIGMIGTGLLSPGETGWFELFLCMAMILSGIAAFSIMVPSLLSDIIDYGTWKFGIDRAATYFSLYTFVNKSVSALGGALGLGIASWYSFDPTITFHSDATIGGLRFGLAWIPALTIVLSIFFISHISITTRRHEIIRRCLYSRLNRATY